MTSIDDNQILPLTHDQLELVNGGGTSPIPIPPIHGGPVSGPVHTPILPPGIGTPIATPLFGMTPSSPLM